MVSRVRAPRADAARNRDAIVAAARSVFEAEGIYAPIDAIASTAGVGNATLYRNFPTRDDLLAAVLEDRVRSIIEESAELDEQESGDALREWMFRLTWQLRAWRDLPSCIPAAADDESPIRMVWDRLADRTGELLVRAEADGSATGDVTTEELFQLLIAISWGVDRFGDDADAARRRVVLATAGIFRPAPA